MKKQRTNKPWSYQEDMFLAGWYSPENPDCLNGRTPSACERRAALLMGLGLWMPLKAAYETHEYYDVVMAMRSLSALERESNS